MIEYMSFRKYHLEPNESHGQPTSTVAGMTLTVVNAGLQKNGQMRSIQLNALGCLAFSSRCVLLASKDGRFFAMDIK